MFPDPMLEQATRLLQACRSAGATIATAESCTGGLIAALLTEIAGSSDVLDRGFVTYSNAAKTELLGVPALMIEEHGAVSEPVARAMAQGAIRYSQANLAVSVTGVAGPGGGTAAKPVGLVHLATARSSGAVLHLECRFGDIGRDGVRMRSVDAALALLRRALAGTT